MASLFATQTFEPNYVENWQKERLSDAYVPGSLDIFADLICRFLEFSEFWWNSGKSCDANSPNAAKRFIADIAESANKV